MGSYRITDEAAVDLDRIWRRGFQEHVERQADKYYQAFFDRFEMIADPPKMFPAVDYIHEGYRKSVCGVDTIYYRIVDDTVEIMAILGRQDRDEWL